MKKVMVMLGAVALAACTQAASFNWSSSSAAYSIAEATITAGLVNGQTYAAATSGSSNRMRGQATNLGIAWTYAMLLTDANGDTTTLTGTPAFAGTGKVNTDLSSDFVTGGSTYDYSIVFTGTYTDANDVEWTLTSDAITGSFEANAIGDIGFSSSQPTSWTATSAAVPEPTSGLLMLVGLAGLALRRRRA